MAHNSQKIYHTFKMAKRWEKDRDTPGEYFEAWKYRMTTIQK